MVELRHNYYGSYPNNYYGGGISTLGLIFIFVGVFAAVFIGIMFYRRWRANQVAQAGGYYQGGPAGPAPVYPSSNPAYNGTQYPTNANYNASYNTSTNAYPNLNTGNNGYLHEQDGYPTKWYWSWSAHFYYMYFYSLLKISTFSTHHQLAIMLCIQVQISDANFAQYYL